MRVDLDGRYAQRPWNEEPPIWSYTGPFATRQEQLAQQALNTAFMTADEIATYVQPSLPQIMLFRPRRGYEDYAGRQAGIDDIITASRLIPDRAEWYSGTPAGIDGGSRYQSNNLGLT